MALSMRCTKVRKSGNEYIMTVEFFDDLDSTTVLDTADISGFNRAQIENRLNIVWLKRLDYYNSLSTWMALGEQVVAKVLAGEVVVE